jgi:acylphosphatase
VQGVGYRAWVASEVQARQLRGWVRNRRDGAVEAVFAGPSADVAAMLEACRTGPALARVARIDDVAGSNEAVPDTFEVRSTL